MSNNPRPASERFDNGPERSQLSNGLKYPFKKRVEFDPQPFQEYDYHAANYRSVLLRRNLMPSHEINCCVPSALFQRGRIEIKRPKKLVPVVRKVPLKYKGSKVCAFTFMTFYEEEEEEPLPSRSKSKSPSSRASSKKSATSAQSEASTKPSQSPSAKSVPTAKATASSKSVSVPKGDMKPAACSHSTPFRINRKL